MFGDLDWPPNASRRFVSISWASCCNVLWQPENWKLYRYSIDIGAQNRFHSQRECTNPVIAFRNDLRLFYFTRCGDRLVWTFRGVRLWWRNYWELRTSECTNSRSRNCPVVDVNWKSGCHPTAKMTPLWFRGCANTSIDTLKLSVTSVSPTHEQLRVTVKLQNFKM